MNSFQRIASIVAAIVLWATPLSAEPPTTPPAPDAAERASLAHRFAELNHVEQYTAAWREALLMPNALPQCVCGAGKATREKFISAWREAVATGFDPKAATADIEAALARALDVQDLKHWLAFYETKLGQKIVVAERVDAEFGKSPEAMAAEISAVAQRLEKDPARSKLIKDLMAAAGGIEGMVDMTVNFSIGTAMGSMAGLPKGMPRMDEAEVIAAIEAQRPAIRAMMAPAILPVFAKKYEKMTSKELRKYIAALSTPVGKKTTEGFLGAFNAAMRRQALAVGHRFMLEFTSGKA